MADPEVCLRHAVEVRLRRIAVTLGVLGGMVSGLASAAPVDEISALLKRGASKEAYERARRYPDQLGEPAFDYFYGMAAIDAGHPAEGTLALERYVLSYPNDATARLELARGYFAMGENARAREEFEVALAANPPPEVRAKVDRFLAALKARESRQRTTIAVFVEGGAGYDSNVNGGVSNANVSLPIGFFTLQDSGVKAGNGFLHAAGGFQATVPLRQQWAAFFGGTADTKVHVREDAFDLRNLSVTGGATRVREADALRVYGFTGNLWLDNTRYRATTGIGGDWMKAIGSDRALNVGAQASQLAYTGGNAARDADLFALSVGVRQGPGDATGTTLSAGLLAGRERNRSGRPDLGRLFYGGRIGFSMSPWQRWTFFGGAFAQRSAYEDDDAILGVTRRDWYGALEAGGAWQWTESLSVRLEALVSRNRSNIELYEYSRNVIAAKVRYETR